MKTIYAFAFLFLFSCTLHAQTWQWTHPEPNGTATYPDDDDYAQKLVTDNNGNIYELGQYNGALYLTGIQRTTGYGSFIAKYDSTGKLLWYKLITNVTTTGNSNITGGDLAFSNGNLFFTANYTRTDYDRCHCPTGSGSHYTYTIGSDTFSTSAGDIGMLFASMDVNGNLLWNKKATAYRSSLPSCCNGANTYYAPLLATDKNNNITLTFICRAYDNLGFTLGGDFISDGYFSNPYGCINVIVARYSSSGQFVWSNYGYQQSSTSGSDIQPESVISDNNGNTFMTCRLDNTMKFGNLYFHPTGNDSTEECVLVEVSSSGVWSLVKTIANYTASTDQNRSQNLAVDNSNKIYLVINVFPANNNPGIVLGDTVSTSGMFLIKFNNDGTPLWKKVFGNPIETTINPSPYYNGFVISNNNLYIGGAIRNLGSPAFLFSNLTIPNSSCSSAEWYQYFVAKADTAGEFNWATLVCGGSNMMTRSIAVFNNNIYTSGDYRVSVNSLGNLDGSFVNTDFHAANMFFGAIKDQYVKIGEVRPTVICKGGNLVIPFASSGLTFSPNNTFTAELSDANGNFTTPTVIGMVTSAGTDTLRATIPNKFASGSGYKVRIKSSDTLQTGFPYYAYADTNYNITIACLDSNIIPAHPSVEFANREFIDSIGWTNYYFDNNTPNNFMDDTLLLSIYKNGQDMGTLGDGTFAVKLEATRGAGSNTGVLITNPLITSPAGYWVMNRYWSITATSEPTSDVMVRFYFNNQDIADINGSYPTHNVAANQLLFYKTVNGNPDPTTNLQGASQIISIKPNASIASDTSWTYHKLSDSTQFAEFKVSSFSGGSGGAVYNNGALPLTLTSFTGIYKNNATLINWTTEQQINVSYFTIQRSLNGVDFLTIGKVMAVSSNSGKDYIYYDKTISNLNTKSIFYRLQITDKDGRVNYSQVVAVQIAQQYLFTLLPNPAKEKITVRGEELLSVKIYDVNDKLLISRQNIQSDNVTISVNNLSKGVYIVQIENRNHNKETKKMIVE